MFFVVIVVVVLVVVVVFLLLLLLLVLLFFFAVGASVVVGVESFRPVHRRLYLADLASPPPHSFTPSLCRCQVVTYSTIFTPLGLKDCTPVVRTKHSELESNLGYMRSAVQKLRAHSRGDKLLKISVRTRLAAKEELVSAWYLLRGTIVNRTYGTHNNLPYISLFLRTTFGPIHYAPPS